METGKIRPQLESDMHGGVETFSTRPVPSKVTRLQLQEDISCPASPQQPLAPPNVPTREMD